MGSCASWCSRKSQDKEEEGRRLSTSTTNNTTNANKYTTVESDVSDTGSVKSNISTPNNERDGGAGDLLRVDVAASRASQGTDAASPIPSFGLPLTAANREDAHDGEEKEDATQNNNNNHDLDQEPPLPPAAAGAVAAVSASPPSEASSFLLPGAVPNSADDDEDHHHHHQQQQQQHRQQLARRSFDSAPDLTASDVEPQRQQHQQEQDQKQPIPSDSGSPAGTRSDSSGTPPSVHHSSDDDDDGHAGDAASPPESPLTQWSFVKQHQQQHQHQQPQEQQRQQQPSDTDRFASPHLAEGESPLSVASTKGPDEFLPSPCLSNSSAWSSHSSDDAALINASGVRRQHVAMPKSQKEGDK